MKIKVLKLKPNTRFHFGKPLVDSDTSLTDTDMYLHSDVLFSALVNNLAKIKEKGDVDVFVEAFHTGRIKISSCFYCLENGDEKFTFLLPKPVTIVNQVDISDYDRIKLFKKIQFIDADLLSQDLGSWKVDGNVALSVSTLSSLKLQYRNRVDNKKLPQIFGIDSNRDEQQFRLFTKGLNTQVGLRSVKEGAVNEDETSIVPKGPYQVSYIQISDLSEIDLKVHFYFLYEILDNEIEADFELALDLLKHNGIGGERSSGYGRIDQIEDHPSIPEIFSNREGSYHHLSLSKIIPTDNGELAAFEAYNHSIRGGRVTQDIGSLKSVRMIGEGAVLSNPIDGEIVDLSPNTSVRYLRNGKAFTIGLPKSFNLDKS